MKYFRERRQKSGRVFYYFDKRGKPRIEIPLGSDYVVAVRKWTDLMAEKPAINIATFEQLAKRYEEEEIPTKAASTRSTQKGDLKKLRLFFNNVHGSAPIEKISPKHIRALLEKNKGTPTTANRLKRMFSHMFNKAREWGYTEKENPVAGIRGFELDGRDVYVTDAVFKAVRDAGDARLQDAMDLAYLTGQRPGDVLKVTEDDITDGMIPVRQGKTGARRRIRIEGELAALLERINARKEKHSPRSAYLVVNEKGRPLTKQMLRGSFEKARVAAAEAHPKMADAIAAMWFYDLRAKAADDVADGHGDQAAADLLGHTSVTTTRKHYLRRGKTVPPTR
ncbi:MAG: tyrosine-type recombinase/integrase [Xanthomonadaceae bacterium]|nr:tyrosine-type recombinase/integrase [Xanthomonadaceae bacterium]